MLKNLIWLNISLPSSTLKRIGYLNETQQLQWLFEEIYENYKNRFSSDRKQELEEIMPCISNIILLPEIISVMVEKDTLFGNAMGLVLCDDKIQEIMTSCKICLEGLECDEELDNVLLNNLAGVTTQTCNILVKYITTFNSVDFKGILKNIGPEFSERVESMRNLICGGYKKKIKEGLETKIYMSESIVESQVEYWCTIIFKQMVLSLIITKSIDENIKFSDALAGFDTTKLLVIEDDFVRVEQLLKEIFNIS